ncbi:protein of unknown function DUF1177 [Desulforamulus reducens MI-1]|uniref:DUF1177 domain-containing protein n=1 Tax=Desulforamulus reducens (strain ATCC BAA-1160 / DSM 100696 / MI-1) TaxID=349161 RepID=A4J4S4_DESRM|nr:protein of unknown function DUF1177 [Desulforamulus reducens MI-1]
MLKQVLEIYELLDSSMVTGQQVAELLQSRGADKVTVELVQGKEGSTDFIRIDVPGTNGKIVGGTAPTLGIIGRLGGIGARPERIGLVSDADGAIAALAVALKLAEMGEKGDQLPGDVIITTHICPHAPTQPHDPVPFMGSPVDMETMNRYEVDPAMDAILSIDTTKGNRVINHRGVAISPTIKEGYILRVSDDLLNTLQITSGRLPVTFPVALQDITPYGNGLHHINSILQPSVVTNSPLVAVAITSEVTVPGCATGASHETDITAAAKFSLEVAKEYGAGRCRFYDTEEFALLQRLYGSLEQFQSLGQQDS